MIFFMKHAAIYGKNVEHFKAQKRQQRNLNSVNSGLVCALYLLCDNQAIG